MMERLTRRNENGVAVLNINCPEGCKHSTCSIEEGYQCQHQCEGDIIEKLAQYEDLEKQGLLLRLPCGIGADAYFIPSEVNYKLNILQGHPESNRVYHQAVERITFAENGWYLECDKDLEYATGHILIDKLYKETWFLTQEEAEQKLKEMESESK